MALAARKSGTDTVYSPHGTGSNCASPTTQRTNSGSSRVFIQGVGAVRQGDTMTTHTRVGCSSHTPTLDSGSSRVFVEGKGLGRVGDVYLSEHPITSGSSKVNSN